MTTVAIALGVVAWLVIVVVCLGLARAAALGDVIDSRKTRRDKRRGRRAA